MNETKQGNVLQQLQMQRRLSAFTECEPGGLQWSTLASEHPLFQHRHAVSCNAPAICQWQHPPPKGHAWKPVKSLFASMILHGECSKLFDKLHGASPTTCPVPEVVWQEHCCLCCIQRNEGNSLPAAQDDGRRLGINKHVKLSYRTSISPSIEHTSHDDEFSDECKVLLPLLERSGNVRKRASCNQCHLVRVLSSNIENNIDGTVTRNWLPRHPISGGNVPETVTTMNLLGSHKGSGERPC